MLMRRAVTILLVGLLVALHVTNVTAFGSRCQSDPSRHVDEELALRKRDSEEQFLQAWGRPTYDDNVPPNMKMAFFADQGLGPNATKVLKMIKKWGAKAVIHMGDFDYVDNPRAWSIQIDKVFGHEYPYFASIGNHDVVRWTGTHGYQHLIEDRLYWAKRHKHCWGEYGINLHCNFHGMQIVISGAGTRGTSHYDFIHAVMSKSNATWKVCAWHKNQAAYQTSDKKNEVGYEVYEQCRKHGAIIATAHTHSYARTHLMSEFELKQIASTNNTLTLRPGHAFAFVSGLGGMDIDPYEHNHQYNPWWAATAALDDGVDFGALLCIFHVDGTPNKAKCEFRDIQGRVWDQFTLYSEQEPAPGHKPGRFAPPRDIHSGLFVQQTTPDSKFIQQNCIPRKRFTEFPIRDHADVFVSHAPHSCGLPSTEAAPLATGGQESTTVFRFTGLPASQRNKIIGAYLQVMGHPAGNGTRGGDTVIDITSPSSPRPRFSVRWQAKEKHWETHDVWVSPDISKIVAEAMTDDGEMLLELKGIVKELVKGNGRWIYRFGDNGCLAPTLAVEMEVMECE